jgi:hypothetical protein
MQGLLVVVMFLIYIALAIYVLSLLSRFVSAWERISQNAEIGVAAWMKKLREQSRGSEQQPPSA